MDSGKDSEERVGVSVCNEFVHVAGVGCMRFAVNPYGNGVMMLMDRGIPCAMNTQVFSAYTTNFISIHEIEVAVDDLRSRIVTMWNAFVDFQSAARWTHQDFGAQVCQTIVNCVAESIEKSPL